MTNGDAVDWDSIIGRSLSYLCLHHGGLTDKSMVDQAEFLARLGLPRREAAQLLGTSDDSLRVMLQQRRSAKKSRPKSQAKKVKANG